MCFLSELKTDYIILFLLFLFKKFLIFIISKATFNVFLESILIVITKRNKIKKHILIAF